MSYIENKTKLSMQFLADIIKDMNEKKLITKADLYKLSEKEIIQKIENCQDDGISKKFNLWKNTTKVYESDTFIENKYCKSLKAKKRYINPLIKNEKSYIRINKISEKAKQNIDNCLNFNTKNYVYFDF